MAKDKSNMNAKSSSGGESKSTAAAQAIGQARAAKGKTKSRNQDTSKAVRRAASSASQGSSAKRFRRSFFGFPMLIAVIFLLGGVLVAYSYSTRDGETRPRQLDDHWHSPYGVWDCVTGGFLPPFTSTSDEAGIHSHQDGVIHIHPFLESTSGRNATINAFLREMGLGGNIASISEEAINLPDGTRLEAGVDCDGEPAIIQVARWRRSSQLGRDPVLYTEDLGEVRFLGDNEAFTFARAPEGAEIPPPSQDRVDEARQLSPFSDLDPFNVVPGDPDYVEPDPAHSGDGTVDAGTISAESGELELELGGDGTVDAGIISAESGELELELGDDGTLSAGTVSAESSTLEVAPLGVGTEDAGTEDAGP